LAAGPRAARLVTCSEDGRRCGGGPPEEEDRRAAGGDEEYQLRYERVAGIDVAKGKADVCTRLPPARDGGRRVSRTEEVTATVTAILALAARLLADGVELVSMESTSDYWRVWFYVLEAAGLNVQLVNSSHARQLAGRPKTDRLDAQWLARLTEMGLLRPSVVPPAEIRALRDLTRTRLQLVHDRTREWQRLEKLLEGALVKLSAVASKLTTVSAQDMIKAMIAGQRDPEILAGLARRTKKAKHDALVEALDGMFDDHHGELAALLLDQIASLDGKIAQLSTGAAELAAAMPEGWGVDVDGTTGPGAGTGPVPRP
jgi:transposase